MKKVSIIIRAYNRLEWTIETLSNIIENTNYDNYEIIVVNNNSKDGTTDWLEWVKENSDFYANKIKHIKMDKNLGDWYGMVEGLKHISEDSEYVMQVDNDVTINDKEWLGKMVFTLENTDFKIVMLKRRNVVNERYQLKPLTEMKNLQYNDDSILEVAGVQRPVCCYILRTDDFRMFTKKTKGIEGRQSKYKLANEFGRTGKIFNVTCHTHINRGKYVHTNKNVREFI
jgi:glycosyltransferase involved in cell wall biosynthesis